MREDPWEFEHSQVRLSEDERWWVEHVREERDDPHWAPPTTVVVCPQCNGKGRSSLYLGSFSGQELAEDPDFADDYAQGLYDRTCESCNGDNVVEQIDTERLDGDTLRSYEGYMRDAYEMRAIQRMEWRMGA